jgi:hypothetical protein
VRAGSHVWLLVARGGLLTGVGVAGMLAATDAAAMGDAAETRFRIHFSAPRKTEGRKIIGRIKEKIVQDVVLDCYQHYFRLNDIPELVHEQLLTDPDDLTKASEICLNYDKILRMAAQERRAPDDHG